MKQHYFLMLLLCSVNQVSAQNSVHVLKKYNEVITSEAISEKGFISTHFLNGKVYFEIPETILENELLFINHNNSSPDKENIFIFKKKNQSIQLIIPEIESKVGNTIQLLEGRYAIEITPAVFPVLATGNNELSYVIDVTALFLKTPKGLQGGGESKVKEATSINKVRSYSNVVEVETINTVSSEVGPITSHMNFSIFLLPKPMMPRLYDHRMGFKRDVGAHNIFNEAIRAGITKWRLERSNNDESLSEPTKPIIFYLDPRIPDKWKSYVKAGVYEWLPAFEAAGFKNAIIVKDAPIDSKDWSLNSMRYSVIRWENRSKFRGHEGEGFGTVKSYVDQRTGEILKADILIGMIDMLVDVYFTRCSPLDKRALQYPFPDDLMGELIQSLTAHEAGHAFGIKDANFGEYTYPFEKMRDEKWLRKMGHTPSIMNYARQNFIVQPEDKIDPTLLQQKVGPADYFNIRWAYTQFHNASTPDDELPLLDEIVREQDSVPWLRYNLEVQSIGPESINEVVDNNNPIKTAEMGILNLKRVMDLIPNIALKERDDKVKKRFYLGTINLWVDQMKYVESLIGGVTIQYKSSGQKGLVYTSVPYIKQKEAMKFLNEEAFNTPKWMIRPDITGRFIANELYNLIGKSGFINSYINIVSTRQRKLLKNLFSASKLRALEENGIAEKKRYSIKDLLQDLNAGLWSELKEKSIRIDYYRQEIQLAYLLYLKEALSLKNSEFQTDFIYLAYSKYFYSNFSRGIIISEIKNIEKSIKKVLNKIKDKSTKSHLELCLKELNLE